MRPNSPTGKDAEDEIGKIRSEFFTLSHTEKILSVEKSEQAAFEKFCEARISFRSIKMMTLIIVTFNLYVFALALVHAPRRYYIAAIAGSNFLIRNPVGIFLMYMKTQSRKGVKICLSTAWMGFLTNLCSIYGSLGLGLYLIARVANGRCESLDQLHMYGCNSEYDAHALPAEIVFCVMILPIAYSVIFKAIGSMYVILSWLICVGCIAIAIAISNAYVAIPFLVSYIPVSLILLYEIHRQNMIMFRMSLKQQKLLDVNKELSEEAQNELRFMIANMAHDLKTPLSAFMNGVETLSSLVTEAKKETTPEDDQAFHSTITENIKNLFNVNNFMTMTVNRCIDYMKASKGIKLEPRLETINLQEVLSMPLNCMRDLQSRIAINHTRVPASISSHIITDLQWFQENLFCLISNAVKYSSHGHITVSVILCTDLHPSIRAAIDKKEKSRIEELEGLQQTFSASHDHDSYRHLNGLLPDLRPNANAIPMTPTAANAGGNTITGSFADLNAMEQGIREGGSRSPTPKNNDSNKTYVAKSALRFGKPKIYAAVEPARFEVTPPSPTRNNKDGEIATETFLLIEVEDTGIGLSDEVKNSLFAPFKQAQRRAGGTGLGLYSLAKRVDALGGYYGVSNRRDGEQGSIFWFAIPYRPDLASGSSSDVVTSFRSLRESVRSIESNKSGSEEATVRLSSPQAQVSSPQSTIHKPKPKSPTVPAPGKCRVLLVDDSMTVLKMTSNLLKRHGHVVDQEENGADALMRLEKTRLGDPNTPAYDIMLIDLNMPVMDGLEATKRLREAEKQLSLDASVVHHQIVFAFSANSDHATMVEAMEAGADDFICKPFSIQTFQEKCDKVHNDKAAAAAVAANNTLNIVVE